MEDITIKQYNNGYFEVFQGDKSSGELSFDDHYEPEEDDSNPLSDFLAEVSLLSDQDDLDEDDNQVALMTLWC